MSSSKKKKAAPTLAIEATTSPPTIAGVTALGTTVAIPASAAPGTATTTTPSMPSALDGPPRVTVPSVPVGYVVANRQTVMGYYPNKTELAAAPLLASELGTFAGYTSVLGSSAPEASAVAGAVTVGLNWRNMRNACEAFTSYVKAQDAIAWKAALQLLDELKPAFLLAVAKNPQLATDHPGLSAMFDAPKVIARSATVTKRRQAKVAAAKAKATTEAATAASAVAVPKPPTTGT